MPDNSKAENVPSGESAAGENSVALSVLTASGIDREWHEAVAVIQAVCTLLRDSGVSDSKLVPDQRQILIHSDGRVSLASTTTAARTAAEQVSALARLLLSLVSESQLPVKLRLVVVSAISTPPSFATVADFSNALSYFERPSRARVIRDVFLRWRAHPIRPVPLASPAPEPAVAGEQKTSGRHGRGRHLLAMAAAAAVVMGVIGAGAWWVSNRPRAGSLTSAAHVASESMSRGWAVAGDLLAATAAAARSRISGVREPQPVQHPASTVQSGATPSPEPATRAGKSPVGDVGSGPKPASGAVAPSALPSEVPTLLAFDLGALPIRPLPGAAVETTPAPASRSDPSMVPGAAATALPRNTTPVYSIADRDVEPPVPIKPKIATMLPVDGREENLSVVDLVVSEYGQVEAVKLVRPARGVREAMMLSAVKAWQFKPALKDGRPVRYLKRIWIILSPLGTDNP